MKNRAESGFTIIELVVVLAVLATLAMLALPVAELSARRTKERELRAALADIRQAIDAYKLASDQGRIPKSADRSGYPPSLSMLVEGVPTTEAPENRTLYFLRRIPRDPFSSSDAHAELHWGLRSYASPAEEPEAGEDVFDVYSLATGIGLNGIPYREW